MATLPINPTPYAPSSIAAGVPLASATPGSTQASVTPTIGGSVGLVAAPSGTGVTGGTLATMPTNTASQGISAGITPTTGNNSFVGDFQQTYGSGVGTQLANTLANLGSATDAAVTSTNQGIINSANLQLSNLQATDAAHGVSADSSAAQLGIGDFESQVESTIATTDSQMELGEENTLIGALGQEGSQHGSDSGFWSSLGDVLGDIVGI